jgi:hypothetical protein
MELSDSPSVHGNLSWEGSRLAVWSCRVHVGKDFGVWAVTMIFTCCIIRFYG